MQIASEAREVDVFFGPMTFDFDSQPVDTVYYTLEDEPSEERCAR